MGLLDRLASTLAGASDLDDSLRADIEAALAEGGGGNWAAAEVALIDLLSRRPESPELFVALGEVRVRRGNDEAAVESFGRAVDLAPQMVDGWLGLGETLARLGRNEPAREALRKVLSRTFDPARRARAHAGRGRIALALGEPGRAVRELRQAVELAPADVGVAHLLGQALQAAGEPDAFSWLVHAARAPTADPLWVLEAARAAPGPAAAESLLRERLEGASPVPLQPGQRAALEAALAEQLCRAGQSEAGLLLAQSAAAVAPQDSAVLPAVLRALAMCHEGAGRYREAVEALLGQQAGQAAPPDRDVVEDGDRLVRLALGAQDRQAAARVTQWLRVRDPRQPLLEPLQRFADGQSRQDDLLALGVVAPDEASRRFVARGLAPGEVPAGNLFALLSFARQLATQTPELAGLLPLAARAVEAFDRPLLVAVMGEFNAGKSSFVNALVGERVAEVGVTPTTATINVLRYGPRGGRVLFHDGRVQELAADQVAPFLGSLDEAQAGAVRTVEIFVPLEMLRQVEVVDTPGLNSLRAEHEAVARGFLTEADAIVWLFAVGQAAKATERDALALAQAAGKRVLGVLNKADQASADEIAQIKRHVETGVGELLEALLPLSARQALAAQQAKAPARPAGVSSPVAADGGLGLVRAALEERFFSRARALKRGTALASLQRFSSEAAAAAQAALPPTDRDGEPDGLAQAATNLAGAVAAERLRLPARIEASLRQAAAEVAELMQPRIWPFGERRSAPADLQFLLDLLDDAVFEATAVTARELQSSAEGGPALPIAALVERFRAYCRGVWRGGLADDILREHPGSTVGSGRPGSGQVAQLQRVLAGRAPDVEGELLRPLEAAAAAAYAAARAADAAERARRQVQRLVVEERLARPVAELSAAVAALGSDDVTRQ